MIRGTAAPKNRRLFTEQAAAFATRPHQVPPASERGREGLSDSPVALKVTKFPGSRAAGERSPLSSALTCEQRAFLWIFL